MTTKVLADTSVLVAAIVESHPAHRRALVWLQRARGKELALFVCAHTLAELYAVLTRLPLSPRISPELARRLVRDNLEPFAKVVELRAKDYWEVLGQAAELGLGGGVVYDALAVQAAKKENVDLLLTLNESDFRRAWPEADRRISPP